MTNLGLIGVAVLSLAIAGPALAETVGKKQSHARQHRNPPATNPMPAQQSDQMSATDFNHLDLGIARPAYPSGFSGPYGDDQYPYPGPLNNAGPRSR